MKQEALYEWDYETIDEYGDVIDHNFSNKLFFYSYIDITPVLALVRDSGNEIDGLNNRAWAYVRDGVLPDHFTDSYGCVIAKVPKRFKTEFEKYISIINPTNPQQ